MNSEVQWKAKTPEDATIIAGTRELTIRKNGYYFITLRLTLDSKCTCGGTPRVKCRVWLSDGTKDLLEGWVNADSCSTGLLGTVATLSAGSKLNVGTDVLLSEIDQAESRTHLAVIMLRYG